MVCKIQKKLITRKLFKSDVKERFSYHNQHIHYNTILINQHFSFTKYFESNVQKLINLSINLAK